jgi:arylsulfatase A-like enzyme
MKYYLGTGAIQGTAAWCAYAVAEFISAPLLFRLIRPYATFTAWHWRLTALLILAYLITGALVGAVAGMAAYFLTRKTAYVQNSDPADVVTRAATLTLVLAFFASLLFAPSYAGKQTLLWVSIAFIFLLGASIRSARWSEWLGFLTNPWIVAALLLGTGQVFGLLQLEDLGRQLGVGVKVWAVGLAFSLIVLAVASVMLGRVLRTRFTRDRLTLFAPGWAALGLALALIVCSAVLGGEVARVSASSIGALHSVRPNIVVAMMDTVRADHLSVYGYERDTTPNLKQLARDSVVYTQAIAPSDITLTSHASLFTGAYPSWHGAHCQAPEASYGRELSPQFPTLAQLLSTQGYATMAVAANLYLRSEFGLQRGFQSFRIPRPVPMLPAENWYALRTGMRRVLSSFVDTAQFDGLYSRGEEINREAFSLLNAQKEQEAPLFLFVNYMDAHFPYLPPTPFDKLYPGKLRTIVQQDLEDIDQNVAQGKAMPEVDRVHAISQYDGGIAYTDAHIGQIVDWLKKRNLYDNSLIVVTSDHGEAFGEKHLVLHGNSAYQNLLHVALMIKFPNSDHRGVVDDPASLIDVAPTILSALGYAIPPTVQGRNLLEPAGSRTIFSEAFPCPVVQSPDCQGCMQRAIFRWPYKLIASSNGKRELFDLSSDPAEDRNLFAPQNPKSQELSLALSGWLKTMPAQARQRLRLDGDALQRLKSLGYVQ